MVNETRQHFYQHAKQEGEAPTTPASSAEQGRESAFFFSPAFFDRQRADTVGHNANVLIEVLERLLTVPHWAYIALGGSPFPQELGPRSTSESASGTGAESDSDSGTPTTGKIFLSASSTVWPVFALLSSIFSRATSGQTGEHHMQRITYGMYGFHHHGGSGASATSAAAAATESFWPTWQELYTGIVEEETMTKRRSDRDEVEATSLSHENENENRPTAVARAEPPITEDGVDVENGNDSEALDVFRHTRSFFQHELQEWIYHPALWPSSAMESVHYCNQHYKFKELDLTLSRITSEGLLFGRYKSVEDLERCLVFGLFQLANLALRLKQQNEVDDHLLWERGGRNGYASGGEREVERSTTEEEGQDEYDDEDTETGWYGDVASIIAFIREQVARYFWIVFDKWMLWEILAHFGLHQVVRINGLPRIPLPVEDDGDEEVHEGKKQQEVVEHVYSPSIPLPARSEVLRLGRKFVGRFHWSQRLELFFRRLVNSGISSTSTSSFTGESPSRSTTTSYLQVIYPRYLTFNGVVSSALRAKQTPYCPREFQDVMLRVVLDKKGGNNVEVIEVGPHLGDCMFWSRAFLGQYFERRNLRIRGVDIDQQVVDKLRKSIRLNNWEREVTVKLAAITEEQEGISLSTASRTSGGGGRQNRKSSGKHAYTHTLDELYFRPQLPSAKVDPHSASRTSVLKIHVVGRLEHQILYGASQLLASRIDYVVLHTDYPHVLRNSARFLMLAAERGSPSSAEIENKPPMFAVGQVLLKGLTWGEYVQLRRLYHQTIVQLLEKRESPSPTETALDKELMLKIDEDADEAQLHFWLLDRIAEAAAETKISSKLRIATENFVATEKRLAQKMVEDEANGVGKDDAEDTHRGRRVKGMVELPEKTEWYLSLHPWFLSDRLMHYFFFSLEVRQVLFAKNVEKG